MKKVIFLMACCILSFTQIMNAQICAGVTALAFPLNPQAENFSYYGVRVGLEHSYTQDVTVVGGIRANDGEPAFLWSLTIPAGSLTAETPATYFRTTYGAEVTVNIQSVDPCPNISGIDPLVDEFKNSTTFINYVQPFIDQNFPNLALDLSKATLSTMQNENNTPVITLPFVNTSGIVTVSVEATKLVNPNIATPNGSPYLMMLRDFTNFDSSNNQGTIKLYDLSYDGYKFSESVISEGGVVGNTYFDMPVNIKNKYQSVILTNSQYVATKLTPGQAQCDYNHNNNISYGECYKCFNSSCSGHPDCNVMCYLFGDVVGWVWSPAHIPYCQVSIGLACIYVSIAY